MADKEEELTWHVTVKDGHTMLSEYETNEDGRIVSIACYGIGYLDKEDTEHDPE